MRAAVVSLGLGFVLTSAGACSSDEVSGIAASPEGGASTGGASGGGASGGGVTSSAGGGQTSGGFGGSGAGGLVGSSGSAGRASAGGASGSVGDGGGAGTGDAAKSPEGGGAPGDAGVGACGVIATFEDGKSPTRTLHVTTGGSAQGDGSTASPFGSIEQAAAAATPGTAIVLHAGTYAGGDFVTALQGTADTPVWIGGAAGEARPVIDGGGEAFHLVRPRYLVVHDLEVSNTTDNGINCDDGGRYADADAARFVVFRNLDIHDVGGSGNQDCLKLSGLNDFWVLDSSFARCGGAASGSGIDHVGCHSGMIARNQFTDLSANGVQAKGGSENIEIRRNRMTRAGERAVNLGGSTGTEFFRPPLSTTAPNVEARDIRVIANVIEGGASAVAFVGCVDCVAEQNTIVLPATWAVRILQETLTGGGFTFLESQNGHFVNNIVVSDAGLRVEVNVGAGTLPSSFEFRNNLWYDRDDPSGSAPTLPVTESGAVIGQDPGFSNQSDFSIAPSSPAAGAGAALGDGGGDYDGRCWAAPPSIGAFEAK